MDKLAYEGCLRELLMALVLAVMMIAALFFWIVEDSSATDDTPAYTAFRGSRWLGHEYDTLPCTVGDPLWVDGAWSPRLEPDTDNRYDWLIIDWSQQQTIQVFTHGELDYALVWGSYAFGDDGNPHPVDAMFVDCEW